MAYILGIDTGGTYTDGVLIDSVTKRVCYKGKVLTTKENLITGITNCINALSIKAPEEIEMVCLSTTLATNAVVEGKGCDVGLISLGKEINREMPARSVYHVDGLFSIQGRVETELDVDAVRQAYNHMADRVQAIVVSGYASTRNPEHELHAKRIIGEMSDIPVICAHQITGQLGYYDRTITALLNARLVPIIKELIDHTKSVLSDNLIKAPVMIVKGDGTFMTSKSAVEKPIDTLLSGPAASIIGAKHLAGLDNATIIDIGGTTSDIALIQDGSVKISPEGATVGGWKTQVKAADIYTCGIGGDSKLRVDEGRIIFGPDKTTPLCLYLMNENSQDEIIKKSKTLACDNNNKRAGFTPTDLAHVIGFDHEWEKEAADAGIDRLRECLRCSREDCIEKVEDAFCSTVYGALEKSGHLRDETPVVAIGAPSHAWMPRISERYGFESLVPEHSEVANAIGAAVGRIEEKLEVLIRFDKKTRTYLGFTGIKRLVFDDLEEAKTVCLDEARKIIRKRIAESNVGNYDLWEDMEDVYVNTYDETATVFVETRICVIATGMPDCIQPAESPMTEG